MERSRNFAPKNKNMEEPTEQEKAQHQMFMKDLVRDHKAVGGAIVIRRTPIFSVPLSTIKQELSLLKSMKEFLGLLPKGEEECYPPPGDNKRVESASTAMLRIKQAHEMKKAPIEQKEFFLK